METDAEKMVTLMQSLRDDFKELKQSKQSTSSTGPGSSSNINFKVEASGQGLRIATTLCVIMFVLLLCSIGFSIYTANQQNAQISEVRKDNRDGLNKVQEKTDRMQDYLNIILQWSPELRKRINDEGKKK